MILVTLDDGCCHTDDMTDEIPPWEPLSSEVLSDQLGTYDRIRRQCPVVRSPRGVSVMRHEDALGVARDHETFSSGASTFRQVPNTMDPPEHGPYRALVDPFFTADRVAALEPRVREVAREIIADLPERVEAVADLGRTFAVRAQTRWLGWEGTEHILLGWMVDNHEATRAGDRTLTAAAAEEFDGIVTAQVTRRHALGDAAPDDPTTELTRAEVNGERLTDAEIVSVLRNWTAGDLGSMAASVGVILQFLATHPDEQAALRSDPSGLPAAIDEMLRIDNPFLVNRRVTTRDTTLRGHRIEAGTRIYLNWASANRDEDVFGDPDAYDPDGNADNNLVWGVGIHHCPGRPLATMELAVVTEELLAATMSVELDPAAVAERETYPVGGWRTVPLRLTRAVTSPASSGRA